MEHYNSERDTLNFFGLPIVHIFVLVINSIIHGLGNGRCARTSPPTLYPHAIITQQGHVVDHTIVPQTPESARLRQE
jgi:hypothetical protein